MLRTKILVVLSLCLSIAVFMSIWPGVCSSSSGEDQIILRNAYATHAASADPALARGLLEAIAANNIYDTLVYPHPSPDILCVPWIAESWDVSDDVKTYTFHLRKGLKFHDGSEITAEDIAFSMDRFLSLGGPYASRLKGMKPGNSSVIDRYTVAFHLDKPIPALLGALFLFKIVNKDLILKHKEPGKYGEFGDYGTKWLDTHDAGSGPYKLGERKHGDRMALEKFDDYALREWKPNSIDKVVIYIIPEMVTIGTKMKKGELDFCDMTLPPAIQKDMEKHEGIRVERNLIDRNWFLYINNKKPPFDDIYVRKAFAHTFDYDTAMNDIAGGGVRSRGPVPHNIPGHNKDLMVYTRDIKKAKELIDKSKYSKEALSKFELEYASVAGSERFHNIALLAAANLKEIGLNVKITEVRWADICQRQAKLETSFHLTMCYLTSRANHPSEFLYWFTPSYWGTPAARGGIYYDNPKVTELIGKGDLSRSTAEAFKYYRKAQELIVEDSPILFMHNGLLQQAMWKYVKGYEMPPGAAYFQLRFDKFWMDTSDEFYKRNHGKK